MLLCQVPRPIGITNPPVAAKPVTPGEPLATTPSSMKEGLDPPTPNAPDPSQGTSNSMEAYGDQITPKEKHTVRLGFQNIGGVSTKAGSAKDDYIQHNITKYKFDVIGLAEINVNWSYVKENDRLINRT